MIGTNNKLVLNIVSLIIVIYIRILMVYNMMQEMFPKERGQCEINQHYNKIFILVFSLTIQKIKCEIKLSEWRRRELFNTELL